MSTLQKCLLLTLAACLLAAVAGRLAGGHPAPPPSVGPEGPAVVP